MRLEGKLNVIQGKHLNRVSATETTRYIRDHLFYGLRRLLQESVCATFVNPLNSYMVWMQGARKVKGEHEQKHNTSYASKLGTVNYASSNQARNDNQDTKAPI